MSLERYGVLKGRPIDRRLGTGQNPHYQIHVVDASADYRIAVNVKSQLAPSELEYLVEPRFSHPFLAELQELAPGWTLLERTPGGPALDFIRTNLFDPRKLVPLPFNVPGPDNDLNEKLDHYIQWAMSDEDAVLYAFGERWGPEGGAKDKIFGFLPGNGVHDIHMNQGNVGRFVSDDGVYQDGALLLHFPTQNQWVGIFLKFQSQSWHTDDTTGHRIGDDTSGPPSDPGEPPSPFDPGVPPSPQMPDGAVRIVAAMVNAVKTPEAEFVTLLNTTNRDIDLDGWMLADRDKRKMPLSGTLPAGETVRVRVLPPMVLPNKGGVITVLEPGGLRVDGVAYTREQARLPGFTIKF